MRMQRRSPSSDGAGHRERITMLLENLPYPQDSRVRNEAESLAAAGHRIEVIAPRGSGQPFREEINGVAVRRFPTVELSGQSIWAMFVEYVQGVFALHVAAARALLRGATVLHLHNPPDMLFPAGLLFRIAGRRVIYDHHDLCPELVAVKFGTRSLVRCAHICERLTFAVANHVIATNQSYATIAAQRGRKNRSDVTVVRNGPPESWTRLPLTVRDGKLDPIRLAYLGALGSQDGVDGLADILASLRDRTPAVRAELTVIGDGDARPALEAALARCGVTEAVTIVGWVPGDRVPELLQEADVCVDPSPPSPLNESSTMVKVAEYLALGKPTVAYGLRETRRTVGEAGLLVPPGDVRAFADAIASLAEDPGLRRTLSDRARTRARELTWEHSEPALLAAYASFNGAGRGRSH
jgi:glycosyltransferase involved in cell wall biosynthesis